MGCWGYAGVSTGYTGGVQSYTGGAGLYWDGAKLYWGCAMPYWGWCRGVLGVLGYTEDGTELYWDGAELYWERWAVLGAALGAPALWRPSEALQESGAGRGALGTNEGTQGLYWEHWG